MHIHKYSSRPRTSRIRDDALDGESSLVKEKKKKKEEKKKKKKREENWIRARLSKRERKKKTIKDDSVFYKLTIVLIINYFYIHFTDGRIYGEKYCSDLLIKRKKKKKWWGKKD